MVSFVKTFRQHLRGSVSGVTRDPNLFPRVDIEDIRFNTRLEERAVEDGEAENPSTDGEQPSACELDIRGRFEEINRRYIRDYQGEVTTYQDRISDLANRADLHTIDNEMQQYVSDMEAETQANIVNPIFNNEKSMEATKNSILNFRSDNKLMRRIPEALPSIKNTFALVAIFFAIEAVLSYVLMESTVASPERMTVSVIYCICNLGFAFWLGGHFRNVNHVEKIRKTGGWTAMGVLIICSLFFNFLIGHYRAAALELNIIQAEQIAESENTIDSEISFADLIIQNTALSQAAWNSFSEDTLELDGIAWFLTMFGFFCCAVTFQKSYKAKDRYPGYSDQHKLWMRAFNKYVDEVDEAISDLQEMRQEATDEIQDLIETLDKEIKRIPTLISSAGNSKNDCELAITVLNTDCNQLLQEYRGINTRSRTTAPPNSFEQIFRINTEVPPIPDFRQVTNQAEINQKLQFFADRLHKFFKKTIRDIENTRDVLQNQYPFEVLIENTGTNG